MRQFNSNIPKFSRMKTSIDTLEDETSFVNLGQYEDESYMQIKMKANEASSFSNYPNRYKFMSFHFQLNMDIYHTDRTTYDVLNMISDLGGILEILLVFFQQISSPFAAIAIGSFITKQLFHLSVENLQSIFSEVKPSD